MSVIELTKQDKRQLSAWMGYTKEVELKLLYSAVRDGCSQADFHRQCNDKAPTLVVASNIFGYTFGGFASKPWTANDERIPDPYAFLFRLKKNKKTDYVRYTSKDGHVVSHPESGPYFGNNGTSYGLQFKSLTKPPNDLFQSEVYVELNDGYHNNGHSNEELNGGDPLLHNVEVYEVSEPKLCPEQNPWRKGIKFDEQILAQVKEEISSYEPYQGLHVPQVRILLTGQIGAGKSSFFNTVNSAFRGHVTTQALAGSSRDSVTTKYRTYVIQKRRGGSLLNLQFCDTMGLEEEKGINISDIPYILDGNIQDQFQFNPEALVTPDHPEFKMDAKLKDKIHVIALVIDAGSVQCMSSNMVGKLMNIRKHAKQRNIPTVVILTKVDKICPHVEEDISKVFHSIAVQEHVELISDKLGIIKSQVLPVKNYESEVELELGVDVLGLAAVRQILRAADGFFDDQLDLLGRPRAALAE